MMTKAKVLVCDDEQDILDITSLILEEEGYEVIPVLDSYQVESLIEKEHPALILIDLWMPGLSGDQVISAVRKNDFIKDIPVIVISATRDGKKIALGSGADDFLEKPYDLNKMIDLVQKYLHY